MGIPFCIHLWNRPYGRSLRSEEADMDVMLQYCHALAVAILVGKVILLSFVVAPILAKQLERKPFGYRFRVWDRE